MLDSFNNKWHSSMPSVSIAMVVRVILGFIALAIRLNCKGTQKLKKGFPLDDIFITMATISSTITVGVVLWGISRGGTGPVAAYLIKTGHYDGLQDFLLSQFIGGFADYCTLTLVRISILLFYRNIFAISDNFTRISGALIVTTILWTVVCEFVVIFACKPVSFYWDPLSEGKCLNFVLFFLITEIFETIMDAAIILLPIPILIGFTLPARTKFAIVGIFMLGGFVLITNILRIHFTYHTHGNYMNIERATIWATTHITAAPICASLPTYKPALARLIQLSSAVSQYAISLLSAGRRRKSSDSSSSLDGRNNVQDAKVGASTRSLCQLDQIPSDPPLRSDRKGLLYEAKLDSAAVAVEESGETPFPRIIRVNNEFEVV